MLLTVVFSVLISTTAQASESWFCTEEASQVQGSNILSCGIGIGQDEDAARAKAFYAAKAEFNRICAVSTSCKGKQVKVEPKRTTCEPDGKGYKCHRLIVFTVGPFGTKVVEAQEKARTIAAQKDYNVNDFFRDWFNTNMRPPGQ